jgi:hypothetical protein
MNGENKTRLALFACIAVFLALGLTFMATSRGQPAARALVLGIAKQINSSPVRLSAAQLIKSGGDTSVLDCYACHDEKKKPQVPRDDAGQVRLPQDHADLIFSMRNCVSCHGAGKPVKLETDPKGNTIIPPAHAQDLLMAHGQNSRNNACFNCHDPAKLNQLVTRDGTRLKLADATPLCASCHGPTFRDWEAGIHGRTTGAWDRTSGSTTRLECASCHDPHAPAFPRMIPLPGPRGLSSTGTAKPIDPSHPSK